MTGWSKPEDPHGKTTSNQRFSPCPRRGGGGAFMCGNVRECSTIFSQQAKLQNEAKLAQSATDRSGIGPRINAIGRNKANQTHAARSGIFGNVQQGSGMFG